MDMDVVLARRLLLGGAGVLGASGLIAAGVHRSATAVDPRTELPLASQTVALSADSRRVLVGSDAAPTAEVSPGTRLLADVPDEAPPAARALSFRRAASSWLDRVPAELHDLAEGALWDLWALTDGLPAPVAGWTSNWRYLWPRDVAFCAVALARTGHVAMAIDALEHMQSLQRPRTWFEARYTLDTGRSPDDRAAQVDGTGLMLWAVAEVMGAVDDGSDDAGSDDGSVGAVRDRLATLIDDSTELLIEATGGGRHLPPVSPDYWEVPERSVTLETMTATLAGLRSAAEIDGGAAIAEVAESFLLLTEGTFGVGGWQRYRSGGGADSARALPDALGISGLVPSADLLCLRQELARPAGGIAPGAAWREDGISWTPSTSLLALGLARAGHAEQAKETLHWLAEHRTGAGSLPEKVLHDGRPASVAPLSWTAANVLLALDALS